jgi:hypothetical protein
LELAENYSRTALYITRVTLYSFRANRIENSASIVETCLPNSNGHGNDRSEFIVALIFAQQ